MGFFIFNFFRKTASNFLKFFAPLISSLTLIRGAGSATFNRDCSQWLDINGTLTEFTAGNPAINSLGYLSEPTAINQLKYSNDFSDTVSWTALFSPLGTITANSAIDPAGGNTLQKLDKTGVGDGMFRQGHAYASAIKTCSLRMWIKKDTDETRFPEIALYGDSGCGKFWQINTKTGDVIVRYDAGNTTVNTITVVEYPVGLWQITVVITPSIANTAMDVLFRPVGGTIWGSYDANATGVSYAGWVQLEEGSDATSYIPTTDLPATRAATSLSYLTTGNMSESPMSGTFDWTPKSVHLANHWLWGSYTDASNGTGVLYDGTTLIFRKRIAGVNYDATKALSATVGTTYIIGWRVNADNSTDVFINHVKGTGHANTTAAVIANTFKIGDDGNGANGDHGQIRNFKTWFKALPDESM